MRKAHPLRGRWAAGGYSIYISFKNVTYTCTYQQTLRVSVECDMNVDYGVEAVMIYMQAASRNSSTDQGRFAFGKDCCSRKTFKTGNRSSVDVEKYLMTVRRGDVNGV